jgi:hypothetical protein
MIPWWSLLPAILVGFVVGVEATLRIQRYMNTHFTNFLPTGQPVPSFQPPLSRDRPCAFNGCKAVTDSTWDDMCIDHSLYNDSGRP